MNKTVYHSLCILGIIILICMISYGKIKEGFEDVPSIELAKSYVDAALANKKAIANTNITITTAKTDIDGISNALSNTATRISTAISLIVSRTNTLIMNSSNTNVKSLLLKNVFIVSKISKDCTMTANNLLNTLSNMISIPAADRDLVQVEWSGTIDTMKNVVLSIQKIASGIIDISPKLSILGTENSNSEVIAQLSETQEQTNNDAETAQLGFLAVKEKIVEVKKQIAEREAASKAAIDAAEAAQSAAASRVNTADYLSYVTKAAELAQAVINSSSVSEANKVIWRVKAAEQKTMVNTETARIAAAKEAARIAAEKEAARIAAEKEAARIAAEKEAARIAAEKEIARLAAEKEAARLAQIESDKKVAAAAAAAAKAAQQQDADRIAKEEAYRLAAKTAADDLAAVKLASAKLAVLFSNIAASNAAQAAEIADRADAEAQRAADAKAAAEADVKKAAAAMAAASTAVKNAAAEASAAADKVLSAQKAFDTIGETDPSTISASSIIFGSSKALIPNDNPNNTNETPEQITIRLAAEAAATKKQKEDEEALQEKKKKATAELQAAKAEAASITSRSTEAQKAAEIEAANAKAAADKADIALQAAIKAKAAADKAAAARKAATDAIAGASLIAEDAWKGAARSGCRNLLTAAAFDMACNDNEYIYGFQKVNDAYQYTCCNVPKGIDGTGGLPGFQGPIGPQGRRGAQGAQGKQGSQGPQGLRGEQGGRGIVGPQGAQGIQGRKGEFGIEGEIGNPTTVSSDVKVKQMAGPPGRKGEIGSRGPSGLQGQRGADGTKGQQGRDGINGVPGDQGEKGERGERGPDGRKGPRGKMAEIIEPPSITSYLKKGFSYVQDRIKNFIISKQNESVIHHM
jgi:hypothetical protein